MKRAVPIAAAFASLLLFAACNADGGNNGRSTARAPVAVEQTQTLVVMGSSATVGEGLDQPLQESWPRILHREAFPRATVLVNAATDTSTVADAIRDQLPVAEELRPDVVAIWLGQADLSLGTAVGDFERDLRTLVQRVRAVGARVLLGNLPDTGTPRADAYDAAIARVARDTGATLVDVHALTIATLGSSTGPFLPNAAGQRAVAGAFAVALRR
jgi:lysophospholipase L1-like esterase